MAQEPEQKQEQPPVDNRKEEMMARNKLNPDLVKKYEQIFQLFEREDDSGLVLIKDIPAAFKMLGVVITEQEILDLLGDKVNKSENPLQSSKIDFLDFLALFVEKDSEIAMKEELMEAFRVFDTEGLGQLPLNEMRYYLRTYGITMPEDEVEELLKESEPEEGYVKYEKFVNKLLGIGQE